MSINWTAATATAAVDGIQPAGHPHTLCQEDQLDAWSWLIRTSTAWTLDQPRYARIADSLIESGFMAPDGRILVNPY